METKKIALCGNPNVGKSTVFNQLTGLKQHTGNWTGKTVDLAKGTFEYKNQKYEIYDLPGTYSLLSHSKEEEIARDFICSLESDLVVVVCDAVCLERNLNLVLQILEMTKDVILCINLMDEAKRKKIDVNLVKIEEMLKIPVVGISAKKKNDINKLLDKIDNYAKNQIITNPIELRYPKQIEEAVFKLETLFPVELPDVSKRWFCLKLLDDDFSFIDSLLKKYNIDKNLYLKIKEELIEDGYDTSYIRDIYTSTISLECERIASNSIIFLNEKYYQRDRKIDKILTSKTFGIPIMLFFLFILFWITMVGANYPSDFLFSLFEEGGIYFRDFLNSIHVPSILESLLVDGIYKVVTWIVAVMLPPMAIFFPLFTLLEDLGFLPRIAFNLDCCFKKCKTCGKQALTMMMGFGCNAVGVIGSRIIDSKRERLISILTNSLIPCNGRFPTLIMILTVFFVSSNSSLQTAFFLCLLVLLGIFVTFFLSKILAHTFLKGIPSSFILELPPFRKPQVCKVLTRSLLDRTLFVLGRALKVAIPAGILIWVMANVDVNGLSLIEYASKFLDPIGEFIGLDGVILLAFILGFPANEIVVPVMLMAYTKAGVLVDVTSTSVLKDLLILNGWTMQTAICFLIFMLFHFPCSTTILTIKKETGSLKWTILSFLLPLLVGILLCLCVKGMFFLFS